MKKSIIASVLMAALAAVAGNAVNPDAVELAPIPLPIEFTSDMDKPVAFDAQTAVTLECADAAGVAWLNRHFAEWFGKMSPKVVAGTTGLALRPGDEAYAIAVDASGVKIAARTLAGVRWAAYTLRPLAIAKRGTFKTEGRILPTFTASDAPMLGFRCVHLCWIPPMTGVQIERAIRLAAMMKFNYVILEPWGMYKSEKNPWWCWPDAQMTKEEIARLRAIADDLGITLIPQFNMFGSENLGRGVLGGANPLIPAFGLANRPQPRVLEREANHGTNARIVFNHCDLFHVTGHYLIFLLGPCQEIAILLFF